MDQVDERREQECLLDRAMRDVRSDFSESTWRAFQAVTTGEQSPQEASRHLGISVQAIYIAKCRVLDRLRRRIREIQPR